MHIEQTETEAALENIEFRIPSAVVLISSDVFGQRDPMHGRMLTKNFILSMASRSELPEKVILMGSGLWLLDDKAVFESLRYLEQKEVEIIACEDSIQDMGVDPNTVIGRIAGMDEIVDTLFSASKIISI